MDNTQLQSLEEKLQQLLRRYKRLQKENENLKEELHRTSKELALSRNDISVLQQQLDVKKLGVQNWTDQEKKTLNARIDAYLKEIDSCLHLLNS
ncbi:hypothetical protein ACFSPU_00755 [Haoranjiania flava]|uniref:Uncharacterized protein n=1 Tax=Haoranjiania flava TaxID=1856322 RepID=A0AAE3IQJ7_9BACT|nr:hypothetical protein [Haoranjiania flava]MCU7693977.1 hypothetical protein [Haoranjiania flava]